MQQKLALILTRARQSSNQFSEMTSLVEHTVCKCSLRKGLVPYLYKAICFTAQTVSGSSAGEHQPRVNKQHYVLLIILNKNVNTNMTLFHPDDLWRMFWQLNCLFFSLCCTHLEEALVQPIIGGRIEIPVTQIYMTNEEGTAQQNTNKMNLKNAHMYSVTKKKKPTVSVCSFDKQTLQAEFICSCKWRDGSEDQLANYLSCWLYGSH